MSLEGRACKGVPTAVFFEDDWYRHKTPYTIALGVARSFCDTCPVRAECLAIEMDYEAGTAADHRSGVYAGLTPQQRHSLEKRGTPYEGRDPVRLRNGLPDRGDQWTARHTELANEVIAWLVENVEDGGTAPTAAKLARTMNKRVVDMRRVYSALLEDMIIDGDLVRHAIGSTKNWIPPHLRTPA